jgi:sugar phosphate isomerase/epimerase
MYKAFSSGLLGFRGRALKEDAPLAAKYHYEGISIDIAEESQNDPGEVRELLEKNRLKPACFGLPLDFRTTRETFEEGMEKLPAYCEFARKIGNTRCNTYILPASDTLDYKTNYELHKKRLTAAAKTLEEYGILFGLEFVGPPSFRRNKKYEFIHNLDTLMELLNDIGTSNVGILMDAFHWDLAGQTYEDFKKIPDKRWVTLAHINDGIAGVPAEEQQDQVRELPGATGFIRIADFFKGLQELNYDGPVLVEPFYQPFKTMALEDAVKMAKDAMDKVWPR